MSVKMFRLISLLAVLLCVHGFTIPRGMVPLPDGRIVGGHPTTIDSFPHQVSLRYFNVHRCGGSIISEDTVITAAHCVDGLVKSLTAFAAGTSAKTGGTIISVEKMIMHEKFVARTFDNDIAIVKLKGRYTFNDKIQPISLPEAQEIIRDGSKALVSGWGTTSEGGSSPSNLQFVELQIVDQLQCAQAYRELNAITETMLCAGGLDGGKDACQGDSGGPLIIGNKLVGVVSWGNGCARPGYPGVYANVASLRSWIDSKL